MPDVKICKVCNEALEPLHYAGASSICLMCHLKRRQRAYGWWKHFYDIALARGLPVESMERPHARGLVKGFYNYEG
jgi:hypothetical protein